MDISKAEQSTFFSQPIRQIVTMFLAVALVCAGAWLIHGTVLGIIDTNPLLNGFIILVFALGVVTCFWQVFTLVQSVSWIERFVRHEPGYEDAAAPRLLAPLAQLLRTRGARMQISSSASRSILESVETRIEEARDITRYLINLLVFLGLLGTFYGLATTVPAIVETIRSLAPQAGESGMDVFGKLMKGLESQLGGMGTAFSSSLLGLAGSLVVGLLELFANHGQNRFARELEEWLSSITRVGFSSGDGESGEAGVTSAVLDHLAEQIEVMQSLFAQVEANRSGVEQGLAGLEAGLGDLRQGLGDLTGAVAQLTAQISAESGQTAALNRIAEGQERLIAALTGAEGGAHSDAESRMRLRSIDVQLLRILEEISAGRQESLADLRGDISALTASVRQLARGIPARG
ncbi:biopolymer transporter ExbB [Cypionkella sp.]|uniref:biopolymer transporter ExbB n=1 Tax=Cypionkella sp. TaxID=2811411 RepID=UPI002728B960|nr:biopolymer transporter ExbB [Cypionkella sp.]MDO8986540.1 biopolymer transporter ExbB [Cypionkella sp.]MDP2051498.1 biopolymer transporter ExbB [Cypionkella sp.]